MKSLYTYFIIGLLALEGLAGRVYAQSEPLGVEQNRSQYQQNRDSRHRSSGSLDRVATSSWVLITDNRTSIQSDKLCIDFDMVLKGKRVGAGDALILTPILQNEGIVHPLPRVIINGADRDILYRRSLSKGACKGKASLRQQAQLDEQPPYAVIKIKKLRASALNYRLELPLRAWMVGSKLWIRDDLKACLMVDHSTGNQMVERNVNFTANSMPLSLSWVTPDVESCTDSLSLALYFPENVTQIEPLYMGNQETLEKTHDLLSDHNARVTLVKMVGTASPEGPQELNIEISRNRALAMEAYLENTYYLIPGAERVSWIGEDWQMLPALVAGSEYGDLVEAVMANSVNSALRESELQSLDNGRAYNYLMEHVFSQLRRVDYTIYYRPGEIGLTKARQMVASGESELSLQEMMLVAWSYPVGSKEFNHAILLAAQTYPQSAAANLNASALMLSQGNITQAQPYLDRIQNWPQALNNTGVAQLLQGNYKQAILTMQQAADEGSSQALDNLTLLHANIMNK